MISSCLYDGDESQWLLDPTDGSVLFGSCEGNWAFSLWDFAFKLHKKIGYSEEKFVKKYKIKLKYQIFTNFIKIL